MAAKAKKEILIPHLPDGSIPHYLYYHDVLTVTWKAAEPFHAILKLDHVSSGRSAVTFHWKDEITGATYPMTQAEFNRMLREAEWVGPLLLDGLWRPKKRGENYLIEAVLPDEVGPPNDALKSAIGKWPGDETDEQVNEALRELS